MGPGGEQVGVVRTEVALSLAQDADLDLVEVAPDARPPVCKLMDFGKFKYESDMKAREARRNQTNTILKEIRFRLKIDPHDYETKKGHVVRFLKAGDKVKVMIMFRGREQSRPEMGVRLLQRLAEDVAELGFVESMPKQDGRNMTMVLGPTKKKAEAKVEQRKQKAAEPEPEAAPVRGSRREKEAAAKAAERAERGAPASGSSSEGSPLPSRSPSRTASRLPSPPSRPRRRAPRRRVRRHLGRRLPGAPRRGRPPRGPRRLGLLHPAALPGRTLRARPRPRRHLHRSRRRPRLRPPPRSLRPHRSPRPSPSPSRRPSPPRVRLPGQPPRARRTDHLTPSRTVPGRGPNRRS
nr:translation initiation factor IF-3 [Paraoerskovia sediminicola]